MQWRNVLYSVVVAKLVFSRSWSVCVEDILSIIVCSLNFYLFHSVVEALQCSNFTYLHLMVQRTLFNVWSATLNLWDSVIRKRINLQQLKLELKLNSVLNDQVMPVSCYDDPLNS